MCRFIVVGAQGSIGPTPKLLRALPTLVPSVSSERSPCAIGRGTNQRSKLQSEQPHVVAVAYGTYVSAMNNFGGSIDVTTNSDLPSIDISTFTTLSHNFDIDLRSYSNAVKHTTAMSNLLLHALSVRSVRGHTSKMCHGNCQHQ